MPDLKARLKAELIDIENKLAELKNTPESEFHKIMESIECLSIPGIKVRINSRGALYDECLTYKTV